MLNTELKNNDLLKLNKLHTQECNYPLLCYIIFQIWVNQLLEYVMKYNWFLVTFAFTSAIRINDLPKVNTKGPQKDSFLFKCCVWYKLWEDHSCYITVSIHMFKPDIIVPLYHNNCCCSVFMSTSNRYLPLEY